VASAKAGEFEMLRVANVTTSAQKMSFRKEEKALSGERRLSDSSRGLV
jgi:hypothetical protein